MTELQVAAGACDEVVDGQLRQAHRSFLADANGPGVSRRDGERQYHIVGLIVTGLHLGGAAVVGLSHLREQCVCGKSLDVTEFGTSLSALLDAGQRQAASLERCSVDDGGFFQPFGQQRLKACRCFRREARRVVQIASGIAQLAVERLEVWQADPGGQLYRLQVGQLLLQDHGGLGVEGMAVDFVALTGHGVDDIATGDPFAPIPVEGFHRLEGLHGAARAAKHNDEAVASVMKQQDLVAGQHVAGGALGDGAFQAVGVDGRDIVTKALFTVRPADDLGQGLACWFSQSWLLQPMDMQHVLERFAEPLPAAGANRGIGLRAGADVSVPITGQCVFQSNWYGGGQFKQQFFDDLHVELFIPWPKALRRHVAEVAVKISSRAEIHGGAEGQVLEHQRHERLKAPATGDRSRCCQLGLGEVDGQRGVSGLDGLFEHLLRDMLEGRAVGK